ncbi:MAG: AmmeMemoRadiSam system protein B, partial [Gemmataceae bacterium]
MNGTPERPRLRPGLQATRDGTQFQLHDPLRITPHAVTLSGSAIRLLEKHFQGERTLAEIVAATNVPGLTLESLQELTTTLDRCLFLDSPYWRAYLASPDRYPSCLGCYAETPAGIDAQLRELFTRPGGPGLPAAASTPTTTRAILAPHMDYVRGNVTYAHAFAEAARVFPGNLFVIIGTSHYSGARFSLTRKNFSTPYGTVPTDTAYLDRIGAVYGRGLYDDPLAHLPEHSIELEVVFLQHLFRDRPLRIVP